MSKSKKIGIFVLLSPIILLFAFGIFMATARKVTPNTACVTSELTGLFDVDSLTAHYQGMTVPVPGYVADAKINPPILGVAAPSERWIEVDLSDQRLRAWDGSQLYLETPVSTGLRWYPTPTGEFRIWIKLRYTKMEGGQGRYYYYLPNVPFVMYFGNREVPNWRGYGLHGTYWHNDFGTQRSHGCVNLPTPMAEKLYYWLGPVLADGKNVVYASKDNPGSRVIIHD